MGSLVFGTCLKMQPFIVVIVREHRFYRSLVQIVCSDLKYHAIHSIACFMQPQGQLRIVFRGHVPARIPNTGALAEPRQATSASPRIKGVVFKLFSGKYSASSVMLPFFKAQRIQSRCRLLSALLSTALSTRIVGNKKPGRYAGLAMGM